MTKKRKHHSMEELLSELPDTGIERVEGECEAAESIAAHSEFWTPKLLLSPGRPKRGTETGSVGRSIRLPPEHWRRIQAKAERQHLTLHAAMRKVLLDWADSPDESTSKTIQSVS